jgi:DHA1 family tetracycline resistance protein-like MFS transporter
MALGRTAAMRFIFITLLIDTIGFGLIYPVLPKLIEQLTHGSLSDASRWNAWLMLSYAGMQFIFAPVVGSLSDKYGRRPVLLFSLFGFGLDYILLSVAPTIWWLMLGRAIAGITGASFTTASAYIADISTSGNKAKNFGLIGAAFGLGFIIGPAIGGLLGELGSRMPFIVAACLTLLNFAYGYFVLPESLSPENRRPFEWSRSNPLASLLRIRNYHGVGGLMIALLFVYIGGFAVQSTWAYFTIEKFKWSTSLIGLSLTVVGILIAGVQGGLIRILNPRLGNEKSIYLGLLLYTAGLVLFSIADSTWMMFVFLIPYCLGGIAGPALQAVISEHVPANEQGELQGTLTSLMSITMVIGPVLMNNLFYFFTDKKEHLYFPGAPFAAGAVFMLLSAIIAAASMRHDSFINRAPREPEVTGEVV